MPKVVVTISHDAASGNLVFDPDPVPVKYFGTSIKWRSDDGDWEVAFKGGETPLVNGFGRPLPSAAGRRAGRAKGGFVSSRATPGHHYRYGGALTLPTGERVEQDPEIVIDDNPVFTKGKGRRTAAAAKKKKKKPTGKARRTTPKPKKKAAKRKK